MQDWLEPLLELQNRDRMVHEADATLSRLPAEYGLIQGKMDAEKASLQQAQERIRQMEVKRSNLDLELHSEENRIFRFRTQQATVKKTEEYNALSHELKAAEKRASEIADQEIDLLMALDEGRSALKIETEERTRRIAQLTHEAEALKARENEVKARREEYLHQVHEARKHVPLALQQLYDRVRKQGSRGLYVVPVNNGNCGGCNLRIDGEVDARLRTSSDPVCCNNCQRILYREHA